MARFKNVKCDWCNKDLGSFSINTRGDLQHGGLFISLLEVIPMFEKVGQGLDPNPDPAARVIAIYHTSSEDVNGIDVCNTDCFKHWLDDQLQKLGYSVPAAPAATLPSLNMVEHLLKKDAELHAALANPSGKGMIETTVREVDQLVRDCESSLHTLPGSFQLVPKLIRRYWERVNS